MVEITNQEVIKDLVATSKKAQLQIEDYSQAEIDQCVKVIGKAIYDHAEVLATEAHNETGFGNIPSKINKHTGITTVMWDYLKNQKSVGVIEEDPINQVVTLAKPMGVVASVTPSTNPTSTAIHNAMIALKSRNSIIIAPHPKAKNCTLHAVEIMQDALEKVGAPRELILTIQNPSLEMTNALMEEADVVVATGGFGMVKSAYSSGRPSFGVGQGNVQSFIDTTADVDFATETIITNRSADLGLPCTGEQTVYIPRHLEKEVLTSFEKNGAYVLTDEEVIKKLRQKVFVNNHQNLELTGKKPSDAVKIMELGIDVPEETRLLVVKVNQHGEEEVLAKEILWPILRFRLYDNFDEALEWGRINLLMEGAGHTSTIYSATDENIVKAGDRLPVGRVVVNQGGGAGSGARFNNGLDPTISLGCGSWGNNSISENLTHRHLMNVTKVSKVITDAKIPTPEEIWA